MNPLIYVVLFLIALCALFLYFYIRKAYAVRSVCAMSIQDKLARINQIAAPMGFEYKLFQNLFTSDIDAWQKECGYCSLYDRQAPFFHMVFDCEPVYFDYDGKTWLVEFWKGQYGIAAGCEIGIYRADRLIQRGGRDRTLFHSVCAGEMPVFSIALLHNTLPVCRLCERHWWLAGFSVGLYAHPKELAAKIAIVFPRQEMCQAFLTGLTEAGYRSSEIYVNHEAVSFTFSQPRSIQPFPRRTWYSRWVLFKNRLLLRLYLKTTEPFRFTPDRLLLLYEYLPSLLRYILKMRRTGRKRRRGHERRFKA